MHPIFLAHLVADFLLQPKWLVEWKEKSWHGIAVHSGIHTLAMTTVMIPRRFDLFAIILVIALLHGFIDSIKIRYQKNKKNFGIFFLADQLAHLAVIIGASFLISPISVFWTNEAGRFVFVIFLIFSFGVAWWNLSHLKKFPLKTTMERLARFALLIFVFAIFLLPSLSAASFCSSL